MSFKHSLLHNLMFQSESKVNIWVIQKTLLIPCFREKGNAELIQIMYI